MNEPSGPGPVPPMPDNIDWFDHIDPSTATKVRIISDGVGHFMIDAADDNDPPGYIEACWDSFFTTADDGVREWDLIPSVEKARELVPLFIEENVPHLAGTEPVVLD